MSDATLYTERGLPRRSAKEKATGTIEQIQVKKIPIIEGEIRKKRAYNRKSDNKNTNKKATSPRNNNKRHKKADPEDEPKLKKRKIYKNSEDKQPIVSESSESEDSAEASDSERSDEDTETRIHNYETITENVYVNRKPRRLKDEEIPVCTCPRASTSHSASATSARSVPSSASTTSASPACGPQCINRMMCIECVSGHCPSGEACTNQRFQRRDYPLVTLFDAGKKGFGVRTTSDIKSGQLVIEYVGEVISIDEARKRMGVDSDDSSDEADTPRKRRRAHFYTLTLTGNECIDASRKGNVARFINHSCDPNCITQKWFVNGETRVGIFAIRDIAQDDELTFDYQFERFGSSRQRCYCGSKNCRKFLCAKPIKELISAKSVRTRPVVRVADREQESKRRCRHILSQLQPQISYFLRQFQDHHYDLPDSDESEDEGTTEPKDEPVLFRDLVEEPLHVSTRVEPHAPQLFLKRNVAAVRRGRRQGYRALLYSSFQKEKEDAAKREKARDEEKKKKRTSHWMLSISVERLLKKNLVEITE